MMTLWTNRYERVWSNSFWKIRVDIAILAGDALFLKGIYLLTKHVIRYQMKKINF